MPYENASSFAIIFASLITTDHWAPWMKFLEAVNELFTERFQAWNEAFTEIFQAWNEGWNEALTQKAIVVTKEKGEPNNNHSNIVFFVI